MSFRTNISFDYKNGVLLPHITLFYDEQLLKQYHGKIDHILSTLVDDVAEKASEVERRRIVEEAQRAAEESFDHPLFELKNNFRSKPDSLDNGN
jgi:hypothetical protein